MSSSAKSPDITIHSFRVEMEPVNGGDGSMMELVVYPNRQNVIPAHPDKTIQDLERGDIFTHRDWRKQTTQYRFKRACVYGSTLCKGSYPWRDSIREAAEVVKKVVAR